MGDFYIENIENDISSERRNIKEFRDWIVVHQKSIEKAKKEMARLYNQKKVIKAKRKSGSYNCDHSKDEFNFMGLYINSGLGYAGEYCPRCGTLYNDDSYPAITMKPTEPFKKDCEHIWFSYNDLKKSYPDPILSVYGRWCSVCGRLEEER